MDTTTTGARTTHDPPPLPGDAPLLSLDDAAAYLRVTPAALRKTIEGRADGSDGELGDRLRKWLVVLTPRRRYIRRAPLLAWLREKAGEPGLRLADPIP